MTQQRRLLPALAVVLALGGPALADPAPLAGTGFAGIPLGPVAATLTPFVTLPSDQADAPRALIQYAVPVAGSDALFINNLNGQIYRTSTAGAAPGVFMDMRVQDPGFDPGPTWATGGPGLMGIAFHPNYAGDPQQPGYGVFYTSSWVRDDGTPPNIGNTPAGTNNVAIREFTAVDPTAATFSGTSREVLRLGGYTNGHINGAIGFNPTAAAGSADYGNLYISNGDGNYNDPLLQSQNLGLSNGKILRINPLPGPNGAAYTVPADNPFVGQAGKLGEIWAYGFRNPQSFSWDALTGAMYINDIGQGSVEEVNLGVAGGNYGWPLREGPFATNYSFGNDPNNENIYALPADDAGLGFSYPVAAYDHSQGNAVGSGFLYRGTALPALYGDYVMADIVSGLLYYFDPAAIIADGLAPLQRLDLLVDGASADLRDLFGFNSFLVSPRVDARLSMDADGELLLLLKANGTAYRLTSVDTPEPASLAILGTGLLGLASRRRRR